MGIPRHARRHTGTRSRRLGQCFAQWHDTDPLDGDDLPRAEGKLRLQRLDDLLGAGSELAAGTHAAVLTQHAASRSRPARAADHAEPAATSAANVIFAPLRVAAERNVTSGTRMNTTERRRLRIATRSACQQARPGRSTPPKQ